MRTLLNVEGFFGISDFRSVSKKKSREIKNKFSIGPLASIMIPYDIFCSIFIWWLSVEMDCHFSSWGNISAFQIFFWAWLVFRRFSYLCYIFWSTNIIKRKMIREDCTLNENEEQFMAALKWVNKLQFLFLVVLFIIFFYFPLSLSFLASFMGAKFSSEQLPPFFPIQKGPIELFLGNVWFVCNDWQTKTRVVKNNINSFYFPKTPSIREVTY